MPEQPKKRFALPKLRKLPPLEPTKQAPQGKTVLQEVGDFLAHPERQETPVAREAYYRSLTQPYQSILRNVGVQDEGFGAIPYGFAKTLDIIPSALGYVSKEVPAAVESVYRGEVDPVLGAVDVTLKGSMATPAAATMVAGFQAGKEIPVLGAILNTAESMFGAAVREPVKALYEAATRGKKLTPKQEEVLNTLGVIAGFGGAFKGAKTVKKTLSFKDLSDAVGEGIAKTGRELGTEIGELPSEVEQRMAVKARTEPLPPLSVKVPILQKPAPIAEPSPIVGARGEVLPTELQQQNLPVSPILTAQGTQQPVSGAVEAQGVLTPKERPTQPFVGRIEPKPISVQVEAEPPLQIPEFKNSNEATQYGRENPQAMETLKLALKNADERIKTVKREKDRQAVVNESTRRMFINEALDAAKNPKKATPIERLQAETASKGGIVIDGEQVFPAFKRTDGTVLKGSAHSIIAAKEKLDLSKDVAGFAVGDNFVSSADVSRAGGLEAAVLEVKGKKLGGSELLSGVSIGALDRALRPLTQKIASGLKAVVGKLPESIQKYLRAPFTETPEIAKAFDAFDTELNTRKRSIAEMESMVRRPDASPAEQIALDRVLRGHPDDFNKLPDELKTEWQPYIDKYHEAAQVMTTEMNALGLPIREEFLEPGKHWYPNLFPKAQARIAMGKLYFTGAIAGKVKQAEISHLHARTTDRFAIVDTQGRFVKDPNTKGLALFKDRAEAETFVAQNGGYRLEYVDNTTGKKVIETYATLKERTQRIDDLSATGQMRNYFAPKGQNLHILEPMSLDQMVGHGLLEDPAVNMRRGLTEVSGLVAKTRFYENLGRNAVSDIPLPDYVKLEDVGFILPEKIVKANPWVKRLKEGYVPKSLAEELQTAYGKSGLAKQLYQMINRGMKKALTVFNPFRYIKQPIENELSLYFMDSKAWANKIHQGVVFKDYWDSVVGGKKSTYYNEFIDTGLAKEDFTHAELLSHADLIQRVRGYDALSQLSMAERTALWLDANKQTRWIQEKGNLIKSLYHHEDIIYKYYAYRYLREKIGYSVENARKRVEDSFFYTKRAPRIVETLARHIPFAPRITYEFSKILLNRLRDYPASTITKVGIMAYMWNALRDESHGAAGFTEEDFKKMGDAAPKWYDIILPITDGDGKNIKWSLKWLFPYSEVGSYVPGSIEETGTTATQLSPLPFKGIVSTVTGKTAFGRDIAEKGDPEISKKYVQNFVSQYTPGLLGSYWAQVYKNAVEKDPEKKLPWWEVALLRPSIGGVQHVTKVQLQGLGQIPIFERLDFLEAQKRRIEGNVNSMKNRELVDKHNQQVKEAFKLIQEQQKLPITQEMVKRYALLPESIEKTVPKTMMRRALPPLQRQILPERK